VRSTFNLAREAVFEQQKNKRNALPLRATAARDRCARFARPQIYCPLRAPKMDRCCATLLRHRGKLFPLFPLSSAAL
jgi:hypothetical protein